MSDTPRTDSLSAFLVTQFPAMLGNIELNQKLLEFEKLERELAEANKRYERLRGAVNGMAPSDLERLERLEAYLIIGQKAERDRDQWRKVAEELAHSLKEIAEGYANCEPISAKWAGDALVQFNELKSNAHKT